MEGNIVVKMADFSVYPSGRDYSDGDYNGTAFRDNVLKPAIERAKANGQIISISMDNVLSFGSSFLEEAFGGLVRKRIADKAFLKKNLEILGLSASSLRVRDVIFQYIENAKPG